MDNCCFNRSYDDQTQGRIHIESEAVARFMQQYDSGYGDYTEEKYEQPDMTIEEVDNALNNIVAEG